MNNDLVLVVDENTLLKLLREEDAETLFALVEANREHLRKFLGWLDHNQSSADSLAFIQRSRDQFQRLDGVTFGIYFSNALVGVVSLYNIDHINETASIGYWLAEKHQGRGIIHKSIQMLIQYAFQILKMHRVEIRCALHNFRSRKIPEMLGFKKEGLLKEAIAHYDQYFDAYLFGLVRA